MPLPTIHPGKALLDDMCELNLTLTDLSAKVGMDPGFVRELLMEHEDVTPEVAAKLETGLGTSASYWLSMQQRFDEVHAEPANADAGLSDVPTKKVRKIHKA